MKTIAIIADSHFTERSRWEECLRLHDWIADDMENRKVDLVLHAGDVYDAKSTPKERLAVASWLLNIARFAPVVVVRGNHDAVGDLPLMADLRSQHPIIVEERPAVHVVAGVAVACLPWPNKAELLARMGASGHEQTEQTASAGLKNILLGFSQEIEQHNGPAALLTHAMVRGSTTSTGQPLVSCDMEIGTDDLESCGADFVALGHIHKHQEFESVSENPIVYPGSPRRTSFGEAEDKSYVLVYTQTFQDHVEATWEFIKAPATPMVDLTAAWDEDTRMLIGNHRSVDVSGAEVRFRYTVPSHCRESAARAAEEFKAEAMKRGAVYVKLEPITEVTSRSRAPEIAEAKKVRDKLLAYWNATGVLPLARMEILLSKVDLLEAMEAA